MAAIRAQGGDSADVTGAILVAGVVLLAGRRADPLPRLRVLHAVLPPVVTGAVVMLIGFNLAPVVANIYWPQDQWVALLTMTFVILVAVGLRGFLGRIAIFLGLIFGYLLSWLFDPSSARSRLRRGHRQGRHHDRLSWAGVKAADWIGFPPHSDLANGVTGWHAPVLQRHFALLVLPAVIALIAENAAMSTPNWCCRLLVELRIAQVTMRGWADQSGLTLDSTTGTVHRGAHDDARGDVTPIPANAYDLNVLDGGTTDTLRWRPVMGDHAGGPARPGGQPRHREQQVEP